MAKPKKTLQRVLRGTADAAIQFRELCALMKALGFDERIRGDHHIFSRDGMNEIVNLQPKGSLSKPYQVKQVRHIVLKYRLGDPE